MNNFKKFFKHLILIGKHRRKVMKMCFKMGIPIQGILHDLSKYSWREFSIYKFYDGTRSPHEKARDQLGYSPSWMYHKAKNKHHWEYWTDNASNSEFKAVKIPFRYVIESFCDIVGASKAYNGDHYSKHYPKVYFDKHKNQRAYHKDTKKLLELLFSKLRYLDTEKDFLKWYRYHRIVIKKWYKTGCKQFFTRGEIYGR